jgi:hypothetical protein
MTEIGLISATKYAHGRGVDFDARDLRGICVKRRQHVEAAADAHDQNARSRYGRGVVGSGIQRVFDAVQRRPLAVVGHGVGERVVVLSQELLE